MPSATSHLTTLMVAAAVASVTARAPRPADAGPTAATGQCGSAALAVGSFTNITYLDPPVAGEGVSLLTLTLCAHSATNGAPSATLKEDDVITTAVTGDNPVYCDKYDADTIVCVGGVSGNGTEVALGVGEGASGTDADVIGLGDSPLTHISVLSNGVVATASYGGSSVTTFDPRLPDKVSTVVIPEEYATMDAGALLLLFPPEHASK